MTRLAFRLCLLGCIATLPSGPLARGDEPPRTGPQTEKRFPPLKVPAGFKATLFACDPLIEYPSAICAGPRPGAIFVAVDYLCGLGTEIVRRDEVRLVEDTNGDGYADTAKVFAKGFGSVQGLAYHDGTLYVMNAPLLTAVRDSRGVGRADERRELLSGLGIPPQDNPLRLHCANGVVVGHDGWLYLALGDHGVSAARPEGDRLVLHGGGILRCRPDGRDLHVFATGLRNIYDVALDAKLNVFVRDNENDGGTYKVRLCHSFHGADHGYPYLYDKRPDEALPPLADLGLGISAGGVCYLERQFPTEYRDNLFFCEWGRSVVRYRPVSPRFGRAPIDEIEFAAGAEDDPYGFKPTDLVVQRDGSLMVSDWADGAGSKRGRGRIYHIAYVAHRATDRPRRSSAVPGADRDAWLAQLDSECYGDRCDAQAAIERLGDDGLKLVTDALDEKRMGEKGRLHAIWILARVGNAAAIDRLLRIAGSDPEPSVRAQAVRAIADVTDPVLLRHRLDAGRGDSELAARLAEIGKSQDYRVLLEVIIALGRLRWPGTAEWLKANQKSLDATLAHAAMQALRQSENWPAILKLLDVPDSEPTRAIALRAIVERYEPVLVDGLVERLRIESDAARRREYADILIRAYKKPGPWVYWTYTPPPRPANTVAWSRTTVIAETLNRVLEDSDRMVRFAVLRGMQREKIPVRLAALTAWLKTERDPDRVAIILTSLRGQRVVDVQLHLEAVIRDQQHAPSNRLTALALLDETAADRLLVLAQSLEDGPVVADALRRMCKYPKLSAVPLLEQKLSSSDAAVRAAAIESFGELRAIQGRGALAKLLKDPDVRVRGAAAGAAGKLGAKQASDLLLNLTADEDPAVRLASFESLRLLQQTRALPRAVTALNDRQVDLKALELLSELGSAEYAAAVTEWAKGNLSAGVSAAAIRTLTAWRNQKGLAAARQRDLDRAVREIHGTNGILVRWRTKGPIPAGDARPIVDSFASGPAAVDAAGWRTMFATGQEGRLLFSQQRTANDAFWLAYTELIVDEPTVVEFLASSDGSLQLWLNGRSIYRRNQPQIFQIDSDRFAATLAKGQNQILVRLGSSRAAEFHLRFRRKSATLENEQLAQVALSRAGNPERGQKIFFNAEKSLCLKCHPFGDRGERIGPDLSGVGSRFARVHIVESVLDPSRTIASSFSTLVVILNSGKSVSGVKIAETETTITLADSQGQKLTLAKTDIEEQQPASVSTMPEGLAKRFSKKEFVDLIAFLVNSKESRSP